MLRLMQVVLLVTGENRLLTCAGYKPAHVQKGGPAACVACQLHSSCELDFFVARGGESIGKEITE